MPAFSLLVFWEFWKTYGQENNRNNYGQSKTKAPLILQIGFIIDRRKHLLLCALRDIFQLSSNMTLYWMGGDLINIITNKTKFDTKMIQAQTFWKKSKKNNWAVICIFLFISHAVHLKDPVSRCCQWLSYNHVLIQTLTTTATHCGQIKLLLSMPKSPTIHTFLSPKPCLLQNCMSEPTRRTFASLDHTGWSRYSPSVNSKNYCI